MAVAVVLVAAACSGSNDSADSTTTTLPPTTSVSSESSSVPSTTGGTTTSIPSKSTKTPITAVGGKVLGTITAVDGTNRATIPLPADVGSTAIVHARYSGSASFVVSAVDAKGRHLAVLAHSLGGYDGTFPVGFVNQNKRPTTALRVATTGPWRLDIGPPTLAPTLAGVGVSGHGDAVLARGKGTPQVSAQVSYPGTAEFAVSTFANGAVTMLVRTVGPYDAQIQLPAGPAFISVTAEGNWSMTVR